MDILLLPPTRPKEKPKKKKTNQEARGVNQAQHGAIDLPKERKRGGGGIIYARSRGDDREKERKERGSNKKKDKDEKTNVSFQLT